MDPQALITECKKAAYTGLSPAAKAAKLNTASEKVPIRVTIDALQTYMFDQDLDAGLENEAVTATPVTAATQATCKRMVSLFSSKVSDADVAHPSFQSGLAALVAGSLMTQAQSDAITALGTKSQSPAERIGWGNLSDSLLADWITKVGA